MTKSHYNITVGETEFRIPADYLPDARNRQDGYQDTVIVMGKIPSVDPLDNGASYKSFPQHDENSFQFLLSETNTDKIYPNALLLHWAKQGHYEVPETWEEEGLVHLGIFMVGGKFKDNIYAYIDNGTPIAQIRCATHQDTPNPGCRIYQLYRDDVKIGPISFDLEHLDWYADEGLEKLESLVESWRVERGAK